MKHKLFILASFCAFVVLSVPFNIQGPNAPVTMAHYGISAAQQGLILTIQSVGSLCAAVFIALQGEKYNKIHGIAFGLLIICLISAAIGFGPSYTVLLLLIAVMGVGISFVDVMTNSVVSEVFPKRKNTVLPLTHASFGIGAMLTPVFVTFLANPVMPESFSRPFRWFTIFAAIIFLFYLLSGRRIMPETPYANMAAMRRRATENPAEIFKTRGAWIFMLAGVLYFTFQMGVIVWLPTYAIRDAGMEFGLSGILLTSYFAGSLAMRLLCPLFLRKFSARFIFSVFGGVAAVLMLAALFTGNVPVMFALMTASGFMQGGSVPTYVLICCEAFPYRTASAASLCTLSSGIASLTAPLWVGALSEYTGFRLPMVLVCCALLVSSALIFRYKLHYYPGN